MRHKYVHILFVLLTLSSVAQLSSYKYARPLRPVDSTAYYQLHISSDVLYKARLSGVYRVYKVGEKDTAEVPYVRSGMLNTPASPVFQPLRIINASYVKGQSSFYTFVLDSSFIYASLLFEVEEYRYDKDISLEGSDDNTHWKTILEKDKIFRYWRAHDDNFIRNRIYFPEQNYRYLRLTINDEHSARIGLKSASVLYSRPADEALQEEPVPFTMTRTEDKRLKKTIIDCAFKREYPVTGIKFNITNDVPYYKRFIRVCQDVHPSAKIPKWAFYKHDYLSSDVYNYVDCHDDYQPGKSMETRRVRIEIDNKDDKPLSQIGLEIYAYSETIRLRLEKGQHYVLAYGRDKDIAPAYDLSYFEHRIPLHIAEAKLEVEQVQALSAPSAQARTPFFKSNAWIWGLMIVSILLIGGFAVSLLRQPNK